MSFGQILYYYAYGSYDFLEKLLLREPLKKIKKNNKNASL